MEVDFDCLPAWILKNLAGEIQLGESAEM